MNTKKLATIIIGLLLAAICAWLGASIYLGRTTTAAFKKVLAETPRQNAVRFVNLQHQQGLLSSNGQVEVRFNDLGASPGTGTQLVALQLEYRMANLLLPTSLTRFEWRLRPTGDAGVELRRDRGEPGEDDPGELEAAVRRDDEADSGAQCHATRRTTPRALRVSVPAVVVIPAAMRNPPPIDVAG